MKKIFFLIPCILLMACSHGTCRSQKTPTESNPQALKSELEKMSSANELKVKVYKPDGSRQCGEGQVIPLAEMQKELKHIKVYSSYNKNDGQIRIMVCGHPTGNSNIYEIGKKDLESALKQGFKEWIYD